MKNNKNIRPILCMYMYIKIHVHNFINYIIKTNLNISQCIVVVRVVNNVELIKNSNSIIVVN